MHERKEKDSIIKTQFQDDYQFDLGYHQSYSLVIFLNCLLFSCLVPLIPLIAAFFFYVKYMIDKYNLIFVYFKVYESGGKIRRAVTRYMFFNLVIYLIVQVAYFSISFSSIQDYRYFLISGVI